MNVDSMPIFISSTYDDLKQYRVSLIESLKNMSIPIKGMEFFGSQPNKPKEVCLNDVRKCKIYIGIFALRYGSIDKETGKSFTQLEYEEAIKLNLPILIYFLDVEKQPVLAKNIDTGEKAILLKSLKDTLKENHTINLFTTADDLALKVSQDLFKSFKTNFSKEEITLHSEDIYKFEIKKDPIVEDSRTSWHSYNGLYSIHGYKVAYIPIINDPGNKIVEFSINNIDVQNESVKYNLPKEFESKIIYDQLDSICCRLSSYNIINSRLSITLSETSYIDYLKSGEHLDDPIKPNSQKTLRDEFGSRVYKGDTNLRLFNLTNICGCGVFILTSDNILLATKHPDNSKIYPGRLTFSSSGTMKYGAYPDPFTEIIYKCRSEINHQINPSKLKMIGFGADARKLFFQFSFIEKSLDKYKEIIERCSNVTFHPIPFELNSVIMELVNNCWEPEAEAVILTLCIQRYGYDKVIAQLERYKSSWGRREIRDEWDYRASNEGYISTLSVRYPPELSYEISKQYEETVLKFISQDIIDKDILEVGSGDGRFTQHLLNVANSITCLDLCEKMHIKNKKRLGILSEQVTFITEFAQDFNSNKSYDTIIVSLVLIHNVNKSDFEEFISNISRYADTIFVFEDVTNNRKTSPYTKLRDKSEIITEFHNNGFYVEKQQKYKLYTDDMVFFKFVRD